MLKYFLLLLFSLQAFAYDEPNIIPHYTYYASGRSGIPATSTTDICVLGGSSTKTIRVLRISLTTTQSTAGINDWFIVKRSGAFPTYTQGAGTMTAVPFDLTALSSTASSITISSAPLTIGALVGNIAEFHLLSPAITGTSAVPTAVWDADQNGGFRQPIVLRGATDSVAVNFGGAVRPAGLAVDCSFVWAEDQDR